MIRPSQSQPSQLYTPGLTVAPFSITGFFTVYMAYLSLHDVHRWPMGGLDVPPCSYHSQSFFHADKQLLKKVFKAFIAFKGAASFLFRQPRFLMKLASVFTAVIH